MLDKWALTAPSPSPFWAVGSCGLQAELCVPHQAVGMGIHTAHWERERGQDLGGQEGGLHRSQLFVHEGPEAGTRLCGAQGGFPAA